MTAKSSPTCSFVPSRIRRRRSFAPDDANLLWLPDDAFPKAFAQNASAEDLTVLKAAQRFMAERMKANIKSHPVDHTPIVTVPGPVVDIIREAVHSVAGK